MICVFDIFSHRLVLQIASFKRSPILPPGDFLSYSLRIAASEIPSVFAASALRPMSIDTKSGYTFSMTPTQNAVCPCSKKTGLLKGVEPSWFIFPEVLFFNVFLLADCGSVREKDGLFCFHVKQTENGLLRPKPRTSISVSLPSFFLPREDFGTFFVLFPLFFLPFKF